MAGGRLACLLLLLAASSGAHGAQPPGRDAHATEQGLTAPCAQREGRQDSGGGGGGGGDARDAPMDAACARLGSAGAPAASAAVTQSPPAASDRRVRRGRRDTDDTPQIASPCLFDDLKDVAIGTDGSCTWTTQKNDADYEITTLECTLKHDSTLPASAAPPVRPSPTPASAFDNGDCIAAVNITIASSSTRVTPQDVLAFGQRLYLAGLYEMPIVILSGQGWTADMLQAAGFYFTKVMHLAASGVGLATLAPTALDSFPKILSLDLSHNQLAALPSKCFSALTRLRDINLDHNQLHTIASDAFDNATDVTLVHLTSNKLTSLPTHLFAPANASLTYLSLGQNLFTTVTSDLFAGLHNLSYISFEKNSELATVAEDAFVAQPSLRYLRLGNCPRLAALADATFAPLQQLVELKLEHTPITAMPRVASASLARLQLVGTRLSHLDLTQALPNVTHLKLLDVSGSASLASLTVTPDTQIEVADLSETRLPFDGVDCSRIGRRTLALRGMSSTRGWTAELTLRSCWHSEGRRMLDISGMDGLDSLDGVNNELKRYSSVENVDDHEDYMVRDDNEGSFYPVKELPMLIVQGGSLECGVTLHEKSQHKYDAETQTSPAVSTFMGASYACVCVASHERNGRGKCVVKDQWLDHAGNVAAVVVASVLVGMLVVLGIAKLRRSIRGMSKDLTLHKRLLEDANDEVIALRSAWEIDAGDIRLVERIDVASPGAFGAVYSAKWDDLSVAVKVLREGMMDLDSATAAEFEKEAEVMLRARHANLVRFFGAGQLSNGDPFLVLELVSRGSLRTILAAEEAQRRKPLPPNRRAQLALDIIRGMAHLHGLGLVHRDLKSGNVLVTSSWRGKVADFGSIRGMLLGRGGDRKSRLYAVEEDTELQGSFFYLAPEVLRHGAGAYHFSSDVWSFGILLWELWRARAPDLLEMHQRTGDGFVLTNATTVLLSLLEEGKRLQLEEGQAPAWARATVMTCQALEPRERPTFASMERTLALELEKGAPALEDGLVLSQIRME